MWLRRSYARPEILAPNMSLHVADPDAPTLTSIIDNALYDVLVADLSINDSAIMAESRQGRSETEIAEHLGLTHNTVKVVIKRVRRQLKRKHNPNPVETTPACVHTEGTHERQTIHDNE